MLPSPNPTEQAPPTGPAAGYHQCRHRLQETPAHFHVAGIWLMCYPARRCYDCGYQICLAGRQCPGPEHVGTKHSWMCQRCGRQWRQTTRVRGPRDRMQNRRPYQKIPEPPLRCPQCRESRSLSHDRQCRPPAPQKPERNLAALRRTNTRPIVRQPSRTPSAWRQQRRG